MIAWERWEGTIEYTFMAPVSRSTHMIGSLPVRGRVRPDPDGADMLVRRVLFFQIDLSRANLLGAVAVLAVASISFVGLGITASTLPLLFPERGAQMVFIVPDLPAAVLRRLLPDRRDAALDAGRRAGLAGDLRAGRHPRQHAGRPGLLEQCHTLLPLLLIGAVTDPARRADLHATPSATPSAPGGLKRSG